MSTEVDTRVTPALHPDNVATIEGFDDPTIAAILAPTQTAFSTAYEGVRAVYAAREAAAKNPAWTEEARLIQVDGFASKHLDKITRTFDATRANLEKGIASIEQQLSQPLESKAAQGIAQEIRLFCKNLPNEERHGFIQKALDKGDVTTVSAILGTVPYLSGLDDQFQAIYVRRWHELQSPEVTKRLKAMVAAKEMIENNAGKVFKDLEKAVGAPPHKAKKLREAAALAEKAFVISDVN